MLLGSERAYTRFPALQSCSHGEHIKCSPARAELAINLVYARSLPRGFHPKCGAKLRMPSFLSAKARRKFDAGLLTLLDVVDADPAQKLYRYRKVPGAARAPAAAYELYREFRTNRRPLNVASVVSRTVEQESSYGAAGPVRAGDRTRTTTASCLDRRRRRTTRFHLGRICGGRPPRSWLRYRYRQTRAAPLRGSPDAQAS